MLDQVATAPCTDPIQVRFLLLRQANSVMSATKHNTKLEAKADTQFERLDVIAIVQVKTKRRAVKHAARFNL